MSTILTGETMHDFAAAIQQFFSAEDHTTQLKTSDSRILDLLRQNQYHVINLEIAFKGQHRAQTNKRERRGHSEDGEEILRFRLALDRDECGMDLKDQVAEIRQKLSDVLLEVADMLRTRSCLGESYGQSLSSQTPKTANRRRSLS